MEYLITDQETNESFMCNSEESLLAGMRRSGKGPVQCGCFNGGCGNCRVKILEGQYEKFHRMSKAHVSAEEETQGRRKTISRPIPGEVDGLRGVCR